MNRRERKRCTRVGHKWIVYVNGYRLPFWICARWFCGGHRMSPWLAAITEDTE